MLFLTLGLVLYLANGQSAPTLLNRNFYLIDTCVNTSYYNFGVNTQSEICHCSDRGVHCNYYNDDNCTDYDSQTIRGGCLGTSIYRTDDCSTAQDNAATLASGSGCPYWVTEFGVLYPLNQCRDTGCATGRSCMDTAAGNAVDRTYYDDYLCSDFDSETTFSGSEIQVLNNAAGSENCGVVSTRYSHSDICGSKKSPFSTSSSSKTCKYYQVSDDSVPQAIDQCFYTRQGYYSYSSKYTCNDAGDAVELWHWLDSKSCSGDGYKVSTVSNENSTIVCDGSTCGGTYGFYQSCANYNWDAYYSEAPVAWGRCLPVYGDPDAKIGNGFRTSDYPWYTNMSAVWTCNKVAHTGNGGGKYPSVYYFPNGDSAGDCSGDYVSDFDIFGYVSQVSSYKGLDCAYPQVSGCGQGSTLDADDIPGLSVCSSAIARHVTQVFAIVIALFAFVY